jgi:hypothetical protein
VNGALACANDGVTVELQASWLLKGYFQVGDQMQEVRDSLAVKLGLPPPSLHIAFYPAGPTWKHTYWWREGEVDYAEAQFFAQIPEDYPVLSVGVSVEKGLEEPDAAPAARRDRWLMNRRTWDWPRLRSRIDELLKADVPACALQLARPFELRFYSRQYAQGEATTANERSAFVFVEGAWFQRRLGKVSEAAIAERLSALDAQRDWWVNAYFGCDLSPEEVQGIKPDALADILWRCSAIRRRLRSRRP